MFEFRSCLVHSLSKTRPELVRSQADQLRTIPGRGADHSRAKPERNPSGSGAEPPFPVKIGLHFPGGFLYGVCTSGSFCRRPAPAGPCVSAPGRSLPAGRASLRSGRFRPRMPSGPMPPGPIRKIIGQWDSELRCPGKNSLPRGLEVNAICPYLCTTPQGRDGPRATEIRA